MIWILNLNSQMKSILKATTVKDAIAMLADELGEFMRIPIPRQIDFDQGHDDDIGIVFHPAFYVVPLKAMLQFLRLKWIIKELAKRPSR